MILCQGSKYHILEIVGILVLIHQYELETGLDLGESIRMIGQKAVGIQEDIVEIHHPLLLALSLVHLIYALDERTAGSLVRFNQFRMVKILLRSDEIVLALGYAAGDFVGLVDLVIQLEFLDAALYESFAIVLVIDGESRRKIQQSGILPEKSQEYGVECPHIDHPCCPLPDHIRYPSFHLPGGLVCECKRQHAVRLVSVRKYVRDFAGQYLCLAASCPGNYQTRPGKTHNSLFLSLIQPFQNFIPFIFHTDSKFKEKLRLIAYICRL